MICINYSHHHPHEQSTTIHENQINLVLLVAVFVDHIIYRRYGG